MGKKCMKVDALDLGLVDRVGLIHKGHAETSEAPRKEKVLKATREAQDETKKDHGRFPPLFIGGKVFWINGPNQSDAEGDEWPVAGTAGTVKLVETTCDEFQSLLIKGSKTMVNDHLGPQYEAGLGACGCTVDVEALAAQARKDTGVKEPKKCCVVQ